MGPTAVNALMSYNYAGPSAIRSLTLTFFAGLIEIGAGVLNLGTISFCLCILTYISLDLEMLVISNQILNDPIGQRAAELKNIYNLISYL